jgi:hypothetical protein
MSKSVKTAGEAAVECVLRVMKPTRKKRNVRIEIELDDEAALMLAAQLVRASE